MMPRSCLATTIKPLLFKSMVLVLLFRIMLKLNNVIYKVPSIDWWKVWEGGHLSFLCTMTNNPGFLPRAANSTIFLSKKFAGWVSNALAAGPLPSPFSPWQALQFCKNSLRPCCKDPSLGGIGVRSIFWYSSGILSFTAIIDCMCSDISLSWWWCPLPVARTGVADITTIKWR